MSDIFTAALDRLTRVAGVRGAMIVDLEAGIPVAEELADGVAGPAVAALTASLFSRTAHAAAMAGFGEVDTIQLEAEEGHVVIAAAGEMIVVVVAEPGAQLGMVRLEAHRTAEAAV
jgi:predicted regulator of Ras-like GTPase activity (Roadblock/LC7/MglB family)